VAVGRSVFEIFHDNPTILAHIRAALAGEERAGIVDIAGVVYDARYTPMRGDDGGDKNRPVTGVATDITERARAEEALRRNEERFRALSEHASDLVTVVGTDGTILYASLSYRRVLDYRPEDVLGSNSFDLVHPDDLPRVAADFQSALRTPDVLITAECRCRRADGSWRILELRGVNWLDDPAVRGVIVNGRNITERKRAEEMLRRQALHDALTGLPNRTLLHDRLQQAFRAARRAAPKASGEPAPAQSEQEGRDSTPTDGSFALLLLNLNRFKEINDTLGHHHGDLILRQVAARLQGVLRGSDTVARLGGDEFALLLPGDDRYGAIRAAHKVHAALDAPFSLAGTTVYADGSVGIALAPEHGDDPQTLLRHADIAMYAAKREGGVGGGHALYDPTLDAHSAARLDLVGALRRAIERDELILHYQPIADIRGGVSCVEALVRWRHPQQGLVPPNHFIPLAEETGLIEPLTFWVLRAAIQQCGAWQRAGFTLIVAVNLSMLNLREQALPSTIGELLTRHGVHPSWLRVELTESALIADVERGREALRRLSHLGISVAIDDFGTGYSSLVYLKSLPADEIKIDRSFVMHMARDKTDAAIVRSIVGLGRALGLRVVAEGVENQTTLDLLTAWDCDAVQGYHLSRPLPATDVETWLGA